MDHATAMRTLQSFTNFHAEPQHLFERKRAAEQAVGESFAFQKLHDQEVDAVLCADVVESANVGMIQGRNRARFAVQALSGFRVAGES